MEKLILNAQLRKERGKGVARALRAQGLIPCIMYNHKGESTMLTVIASDFYKIWRNITRTTSINLVVDNKTYLAFIQDTEYDIKTDSVLHADFRTVDDTQLIKAKYNIQYVGTPLGVREGGFMVRHLPQITLKATASYLPERIIADVNNVRIGDTFKVKDLKLDKNIKLITDENSLLVSVAPPKK